MREGNKRNKKIYKPGDIVTFRIPQKKDKKELEQVLELINKSENTAKLMIAALDFYIEYKSKIDNYEMAEKLLQALNNNKIDEFIENSKASTNLIEERNFESYRELQDMPDSNDADIPKEDIVAKEINSTENNTGEGKKYNDIEDDSNSDDEIFGNSSGFFIDDKKTGNAKNLDEQISPALRSYMKRKRRKI